MHPILSNRLYVGVAFFLLVLVWFPYQYLSSVHPISRYNNTKKPGATVSSGEIWNFERDAHNLLMSDSKCDASFPGLFKEVDRAVEHRKQKHVTSTNLDDIKISNGYCRGMIYDQQLYIIAQHGTFFSREYATISAIHRAVMTSPEPLPNIEFTFLTDDIVRPSYVHFPPSKTFLF